MDRQTDRQTDGEDKEQPSLETQMNNLLNGSVGGCLSIHKQSFIVMRPCSLKDFAVVLFS